jgi:short-subunit dehydrogenase
MASILITGASSGIGRELTLQLVKQNHRVWGIARNEENLKQLSVEIQTDNFLYSACDVRKAEDIAGLKNQMDANGFYPDILLLNAGVTSLSDQDNQQTNYDGVVNTWNVFKDYLQIHSGVVAVSGSLFAFMQAPFNISYSQSKLDAFNFVKRLSLEKENHLIQFNYFVLGPINTQGTSPSQPWYKSFFIPTSAKAARHIAKHLGSPRLINIFPFNSKLLLTLNQILPKAVIDYLMNILKR